MQLHRQPPQSQPKVVNLFANEKFVMSLHRESEVMDVSPKDQLQFDANEIVNYWVALGLRTPHKYREVIVFTDARKQFVSIMKGTHSKVQKLHKGEILRSMAHFKEASTNPEFRPAQEKKHLLKRLSVLDFIYKDYNHNGPKSHLEMYLNPPVPLIKEINQALTKEIIRAYNRTKYGFVGDVSVTELPCFVKASNNLMKYLRLVEPQLQPYMGLNSKRPSLAVEGLIKSNDVDRNEFVPAWLHNDYSIANLDRWLKSQGYFKPSCRAI